MAAVPLYRSITALTLSCLIKIGRTQITDLLPCVGSFFARSAKKEPTNEEKHHLNNTPIMIGECR
jgi:hypothetical protein